MSRSRGGIVAIALLAALALGTSTAPAAPRPPEETDAATVPRAAAPPVRAHLPALFATRPVRDSVLAGLQRRLADDLPNFSCTNTITAQPFGETIQIATSDSYACDSGKQQALANWMDTYLFHGSEFSKLTVVEATLSEIQNICGEEDDGCYSPGAGTMLVPGNDDDLEGMQRETVIAHEYGHHVAANRDNTPWDADDWGAKKWASRANVCARVRAKTAYPGNSGPYYALNPGEAFAEAYRLAVYEQAEWPGNWWTPSRTVVDSSWPVDPGAIGAAQSDATNPWTPATSPPVAWVGRLTRAKPASSEVVQTILDGDMVVRLLRPGTARISLTNASNGAVLHSGTGSFRFTICGQRSVRLRIAGRPGQPFSVSVKTP